ncbi:MAG TPA: hypothetical protein PLD23_01280 [Armatimonadota bacterium]|nr:hypothetical protein [Armatimonadota bacterium]
MRDTTPKTPRNGGICRREFCLRTGQVVLGAPLLMGALSDRLFGAVERQCEWKKGGLFGPGHKATATVRSAFLRPRGEYWLGWPGTSFDIEGHRKMWTEGIEQSGKEVGVRVRTEPDCLYDEADVDRFIAESKAANVDGVVVTLLHMGHWGFADKVASSGLRTIIFAPIGTTFTGHLAPSRHRTGVYTVSSLDMDDVKYGLRMIRTINQMRDTRLVVITLADDRTEKVDLLGTELVFVPRTVYDNTYNGVWEMPEIESIAKEYKRKAKDIVEPTAEDLTNAGRNYLTCRKIIEDYGADGLSMICLHLVADHTLPCPPCMAFSRLNDQGILGGCEGDTNAAIGMMLVPYLFGKPGFMQDPVPETTHNTLVAAHCSCATRLNGIGEDHEPFILRSHSESNLGVSMQVHWREGQRVTMASFLGPRRMVIEEGTVVGNVDTPPAGGCRTSVDVKLDGITDTRDVLGFHQVFFYGEHGRQMRAYCQMAGIEAVSSEETARAAKPA